MPEYVPGVCNIGPNEIYKRNLVGIVGLVLNIILAFFVVHFDLNPIWRLLIFVPSSISAAGFLQAYFQFCAVFGFAGLFNVASGAGENEYETIRLKEFRKKDRQQAIKIIVLSAVVGAIVAFGFYSI